MDEPRLPSRAQARLHVDERAEDGSTPLHAAAALGHVAAVALLLADGAAAEVGALYFTLYA